jgi:DNA-binding beta-propeller fold protein YncE
MTPLRILQTFASILIFSVCGAAQELPADETAPLVLVRIIPIPGVEGRFDHMAVDNQNGRVFASVYGNDSVEVLDTQRGKRIHSIQEGFIKPQMVAYLPDSNRIVVSSEGDGSCKIFDADTYKLIDTVKFSDDADQLRYDPAAKRVYVAYGDGDESAIGIIDTTTNKRLEGEFKLAAHPESFQLEDKGPKLFVNLASISQIAVIDRNTRKIQNWKLEDAGTNFPMALDEPHRRLFIAARKPARLLVLDMDTGKQIASLPGAIDTDDMSYDPDRKRIYVTSGEGFIFVYQQIDPDRYQRIAKIPTAIGARTNRGAELWVYETRD